MSHQHRVRKRALVVSNSVSAKLAFTSTSFARHGVLRSAYAGDIMSPRRASSPSFLHSETSQCSRLSLGHCACYSVRHVGSSLSSVRTTCTHRRCHHIRSRLFGSDVPSTRCDSLKITFASASARCTRKLNANTAMMPFVGNLKFKLVQFYIIFGQSQYFVKMSAVMFSVVPRAIGTFSVSDSLEQVPQPQMSNSAYANTLAHASACCGIASDVEIAL